MTVVASIEIAPVGSPGSGNLSGTGLGTGKAPFAGKAGSGAGSAISQVALNGDSGATVPGASSAASMSFRAGMQSLLDSLDADLGAEPGSGFDPAQGAAATVDSHSIVGETGNASAAKLAASIPNTASQAQFTASQRAGSAPDSAVPQKDQSSFGGREQDRISVFSSSARTEEKKSDGAHSTVHGTGLGSPAIPLQALPLIPLTAPTSVSIAPPLLSAGIAPETSIAASRADIYSAAGEAVNSLRLSSGPQAVSLEKPTAVSSISSNPADAKGSPLSSSLPSGDVGFTGFSANRVSAASEIARASSQGPAGESISRDLEAGNPSQRTSQAAQSILNETGSVDVASDVKTFESETPLFAPSAVSASSLSPATGSPSIAGSDVASAASLAVPAKPPESSQPAPGAIKETNLGLSTVGRAAGTGTQLSRAGTLENRILSQLTGQASSQLQGQSKGQSANLVPNVARSLPTLSPTVPAVINPMGPVQDYAGSRSQPGDPSQTGTALRLPTPAHTSMELPAAAQSSLGVQGQAGSSIPVALSSTVAFMPGQISTSVSAVSYAAAAKSSPASLSSFESSEGIGATSNSVSAGTGGPVASSGVQAISSSAVITTPDSPAQSSSHSDTGPRHQSASEQASHSGSEIRPGVQNVPMQTAGHAVAPSNAHSAQDSAAGTRGMLNPGGAIPSNPISAPPLAAAPRAESREAFATLDGEPASTPATWVHVGSSRAEAGFQDPNLGWVSVRADQADGGIHATLVPGSAEAASALGSHLDGLNAYLADRHSAVQSVTVETPDARQFSGSAESGGQQGRGQDSGQGSGADSRQDFERGSDSGFRTNAVSAAENASGGVSAQMRTAPMASLTGEYASGAHISVVA